ncbi:MAG: hypothetical protein WCI12_06815 [Actinomycetes bacterium]
MRKGRWSFKWTVRLLTLGQMATHPPAGSANAAGESRSAATETSLFRDPVPPIGELLPGYLERPGAWVSRQGDDAKPPGVVDHERALDEISARFGLDRCCDLEFEADRRLI